MSEMSIEEAIETAQKDIRTTEDWHHSQNFNPPEAYPQGMINFNAAKTLIRVAEAWLELEKFFDSGGSVEKSVARTITRAYLNPIFDFTPEWAAGSGITQLKQRLDRLERAINELAEMEKVAEGLGLEIKPPFMRLAKKLKEKP